MHQKRWRQMTLPLGGEERWDQLPRKNRRKCQELLIELLKAVIEAEGAKKGEDHEREDQLESS